MKWNLQNRILIPTILLIVAITAAISIVSFSMSRSTLETSLNSQLKELSASSVNQVESWVLGQRQNLIQWSIQPNVLAALQKPAETQVVSDGLVHAKKLYGFFEDIHLADLKGGTVASSNPESIGRLNVADREYFRRALTGETVISDVLKSRTTGNPMVVISTPVKEAGEVRGVIYSVLDLNWFSAKFIADIKVLKTGYAFLFDEKGIFIAHPDKAKILQAKLSDFDWGKQVQSQREGSLRYTFEGLPKSATFKTSEALGWGFVVTVPDAELNAPAYRMGKINLLLGLGALIIGIGVMLVTARSVTRPIQLVAGQLSNGADQTTSAAAQVSSASQSLAEGASEQAASLEETSASLEELSSMTKCNSESAQKANALAKETRASADRGAADMQAMTDAMNAIKLSGDETAKIIKTIDEIAFQTNILALNAAVEAARAGESGMGFAVVADEVRNLAQRSAQAAKETSAKIVNSLTNTAQGVEISSKVATALNEIAVKARQMDELVSEVAGASREQTQGVNQINGAIGQMDTVTQSNAASAEESAAAAEELDAQAQIMRESVQDLLKLVDGNQTLSERPPSALSAGLKPAKKLPARNGVPAKANGKSNGAKPAPARSLAGAPMASSQERSAITLDNDFRDF